MIACLGTGFFFTYFNMFIRYQIVKHFKNKDHEESTKNAVNILCDKILDGVLILEYSQIKNVSPIEET